MLERREGGISHSSEAAGKFWCVLRNAVKSQLEQTTTYTSHVDKSDRMGKSLAQVADLQLNKKRVFSCHKLFSNTEAL
jgi:hypothetical protein